MSNTIESYYDGLKRELKGSITRVNSTMMHDGITRDDRKRMITSVLGEVKSDYIKVMEE